MNTKVAQHKLHQTTRNNMSTLTKDLARVPGVRGLANRPGRILVHTIRKGRAKPHSSQHVLPKFSLLTNDIHCVKFLLSRRLTGSKQTLNCVQYHQTGPESGQTVNYCQPVVNFANLNVVSHAYFVHGQPQKKGISRATVKQIRN